MKLKYIFYSLLVIFFLLGCQKVKPHQKAHLNQDSMSLSEPKVKNFETNFLSYREGAEGGNGGKTGGGCGCN